jgi:hypothetical protein
MLESRPGYIDENQAICAVLGMDDLALACVDHGLGGVGRMGVSVSAMPEVQGPFFWSSP